MNFKTCKKYNISGHIHELTFSCYRNHNFLNNDKICNLIIKSTINAKKKHCFDLLAFVIIPNHVHLLIRPQNEDYSISKILQAIKQPVARKVINHLKISAPKKLLFLKTNQKHSRYRFWQDGGGFDRNIVSKQFLNNAIEYIHNNPLRAKLVNCPEEWKWSSTNPNYTDIIDLI